MIRLPTFYISHGGGPWPWIPEMRKSMPLLEQSLVDIVASLAAQPRAILVISGHWDERTFTVMTNPRPPMVYDYYGFPEYTYQITYPAPGAPGYAKRATELLGNAGINVNTDDQQGFDHGTFAPLSIMYPNADMPIFQLSLQSSFDPEAHLAAGRALAPLREEGVLIVGSGLSYHNLGLRGMGARAPSQAFDDWLQNTLREHDGEARSALLCEWSKAPAARICHPREDHLLPLMVVTGAAEADPATCVYYDKTALGGAVASSFCFG